MCPCVVKDVRKHGIINANDVENNTRLPILWIEGHLQTNVRIQLDGNIWHGDRSLQMQ